MFFSASQLVKCSATQLLYKRDKPRPSQTAAQAKGNSYSEKVSKSEFLEMSGCFKHSDIEIHFSVDEVQKNRGRIYLIEHKMVQGDYESWYLLNSVIQTALYGALAQYCTSLKQARWAPNFESGPRIMDLDKPCYSRLNFGGTLYRVTFDATQVIRFYLTKARASKNWNTAKKFDASWKFKEWSWLEQFINFKKLGGLK